MPQNPTGSVEIDGYSIEFEWGHNRLIFTTRLGARTTFLLQASGLEKRAPKGLAYDVAASAVSEGIMNAELTYVYPTAFSVRGDTANKSPSRLYAVREP